MSGQDFGGFYHSLDDSELLSIAEEWHSLVDDAKSALTLELAHRQIEFQEPSAQATDPPGLYRDLVTIRRYRDLSEAIVGRGVIESAGIFCFLKDENFVRLDWQMSNLIGGISLQVPREDAEAAERILQEPIPDAIQIPDQPAFQQPHCPRCDSNDIAWERARQEGCLALAVFVLAPGTSRS